MYDVMKTDGVLRNSDVEKFEAKVEQMEKTVEELQRSNQSKS